MLEKIFVSLLYGYSFHEKKTMISKALTIYKTAAVCYDEEMYF